MTQREKQPHPNEEDQRRNREAEHPHRTEPDTIEGPGGRETSKGDDDGRDSATRRGER